jgi:hypothetical protein
LFVRPPDAEVGDRLDPVREPEQRAEVGGLVEADPADAEPFGARREPEVLDRAGGAVDVGFRDRAPSEYFDVLVSVIAADAHSERGFEHPFDLLVQELPGSLIELLGLPQALALGERADLAACLNVTDDDQAPRLHQPDRGRLVGRLEHPAEHLLFDVVGSEAADVASLGDHVVDRT